MQTIQKQTIAAKTPADTRYRKVVGDNRRRLLERTAFVWMLLLLATFIVDLWRTGYARGHMLEASIVLTAGVIIALHRRFSTRPIAVVLLLCIALPLLALNYYYSGIHSPFLSLIVFIPVAAFMLVSRPAGWVFTGIVCAYFTFLGLLPVIGYNMPNVKLAEGEEILARSGSLILMLCGISSVGWYYSRLLDRFYFKLKDSNTELRRIAEYKSQFMASMSHEFRTPLNAIIGFSRRLSRNLVDDVATKDLAAIEAILRNGEMMKVLVEDVLEMAQLESGNISIHACPCELGFIVRHLVTEYETLANEKGISLECAIEDVEAFECIYTDKDLVKRILRQLLSNAIKFTDEGSVTVSLTFAKADKSVFQIEIVDTGAGIDEKELGKLFDRFSRGENRDRSNKPGTGLGLAITWQLVELLNGKINVKSSLGEGSHFSVELPVFEG